MKAAEIQPRLLRVREAAARAGVCISTAYVWCNDGTWTPFVIRLGRSVRLSRRGLEKWLDDLEAEAGIAQDEEEF